MLRSSLRTVFALCATTLLASTFACSSSAPDEEQDQGALRGNVASNVQRPSCVAVDSTSIYFATSMSQPSGLYKGSKSGGEPQKLSDVPTDATTLALDDANIYWLDGSGDLFAMPKSGGTPKKLAPAVGYSEIVFDGDSVVVSTTKSLVRVPKAGGPVTTIANIWAQWLGADATKLYYFRSTTGMNLGLFSLPKNGAYPADEKKLAGDYKERGYGVAMDAKYIYFSTGEGDKSDRVVRIDKATGMSTDMFPTVNGVNYGAVNDKALCFGSQDAIECQPVDGNGKGSVRVAKGHNIQDMALDGDFIVYAEEGTDHGFFDQSRMDPNSGAIQRVALRTSSGFFSF